MTFEAPEFDRQDLAPTPDLVPGALCPNCQLSHLVAEPRGRVSCPLCGFTTAPPCT